MQTSPSSAHPAIAATARTPLLSGQFVLYAVIGVVTWLALIGAVLGSYIMQDAPFVRAFNHQLHVNYAALDVTQPARTNFGSLRVTAIDTIPAAEATSPIPDGQALIRVTVDVANTQSRPISLPRFDDLRMLTAGGVEIQRLQEASSSSTVVDAGATGSTTALFLAPRDGGLLWLEYRNVDGDYPFRFALGTADAPYSPTGAR
jgi:hypothetical protein